MSVNAIVSKGTLFKRGDGESNEVFTKFSEVNSISLPSRSRAPIDVTDLDSTAKEFLMGLRDNGQVTISMNFTRLSLTLLYTDFESDDSVNYQIVFSDTGATTIDLTGFVQDVGGEAPGPDEKITVDVTIKITGAITLSS